MVKNNLCKHVDVSAKQTLIKHFVNDMEVTLKVQSWICLECGTHGADTDIVKQLGMPTV